MNLARNFEINEGRVQYDNNNALTYTSAPSYITDWVYRHEGLQKAIYNHTLIIDALTGNGNAYTLKKKTHLGNIANNVRDIFKIEFKRHLEAGLSQELAKAKALKYAEEYKKKALESHEKQFPSDLSHSSVMKLFEIKKEGIEHNNK